MPNRDRPPARPAPANEPDWLTLGQAAKFLGVAQSTIRKWSDNGRVPAFYTPGGHRRYRRGDLESLGERAGPATRELRGGDERAAPRAETLRGEAVPEVLGDVVVVDRRGEVHDLPVALEAKQTRAIERDEPAELARQGRAAERALDERPVLRAEATWIASPSMSTWRFVRVVTPYVRETRVCRSVPTRNHASDSGRHARADRAVTAGVRALAQLLRLFGFGPPPALGGRKGLLPTDVDQHGANLADSDCDLEPDLTDRLGLARLRRVVTDLLEESFEPLDRCVVRLFGVLHLGDRSRRTGC